MMRSLLLLLAAKCRSNTIVRRFELNYTVLAPVWPIHHAASQTAATGAVRLSAGLYIFLAVITDGKETGCQRVPPLSFGHPHLPVTLSVTQYITTKWLSAGSDAAAPTDDPPP